MSGDIVLQNNNNQHLRSEGSFLCQLDQGNPQGTAIHDQVCSSDIATETAGEKPGRFAHFLWHTGTAESDAVHMRLRKVRLSPACLRMTPMFEAHTSCESDGCGGCSGSAFDFESSNHEG